MGDGRVRNRQHITSVTFRSSVKIEEFQHAHVEANADVLPGEDPAAVLEKVKSFVAQELRVAKFGKEVVEQREVVTRAGRFRDDLADSPIRQRVLATGGQIR